MQVRSQGLPLSDFSSNTNNNCISSNNNNNNINNNTNSHNNNQNTFATNLLDNGSSYLTREPSPSTVHQTPILDIASKVSFIYTIPFRFVLNSFNKICLFSQHTGCPKPKWNWRFYGRRTSCEWWSNVIPSSATFTAFITIVP